LNNLFCHLGAPPRRAGQFLEYTLNHGKELSLPSRWQASNAAQTKSSHASVKQTKTSHASPKTATENRQRLRRAAEDYGWHMANAADVELQVH
jgi:hypothetical protein